MAKHNIALVLSSGAARGVAHIAVIEELLRDGHTITSIAGSSMGAVVGGMHAAGTSPTIKIGTNQPKRKIITWEYLMY